MDKTFNSKISKGLLVFLIITIGFSFIVTIIQPPFWIGWVIHLPIILFIVHLFSSTNYLVAKEQLVVSSSFFRKITIDISTIGSILPSNDISSAPALSFDRLKIIYGKNQSVLISPKNKVDFIRELKQRNPEINIG